MPKIIGVAIQPISAAKIDFDILSKWSSFSSYKNPKK